MIPRPFPLKNSSNNLVESQLLPFFSRLSTPPPPLPRLNLELLPCLIEPPPPPPLHILYLSGFSPPSIPYLCHWYDTCLLMYIACAALNSLPFD